MEQGVRNAAAAGTPQQLASLTPTPTDTHPPASCALPLVLPRSLCCRALARWYGEREWFNELSKKVMQIDWSWNNPALDYLELYYRALKR